MIVEPCTGKGENIEVRSGLIGDFCPYDFISSSEGCLQFHNMLLSALSANLFHVSMTD
jgi:hypothetical protein